MSDHRHLYAKDACPDGDGCVNKAFAVDRNPEVAAVEFDSVKDSGERREFSTGSVRDVATGKGRYDLLPAYPIRRLAIHFENGARKYGDKNWEKGQPLSVYISSALRHGFCVSDGQQDEDHAAAAAWNWFAFMYTAEKVRLGELPAELDDIGWNRDPITQEQLQRKIDKESPR